MEPQRLEQSRIRYKKMLLNLGRLIKPDGELKTLKFACSDYIPAKVREKITLAEDLFEALEERGKLSHDNLEFLKDLLGVALAGRTDVLDVIREYEQGFTAAPDTDSARSPEFSRITQFLEERLGKEYRSFLRRLGVEEHQLERSEQEHPKNVKECIHQCLQCWYRDNRHRQFSDLFQAVLDALSKEKRNDLVRTLKEHFDKC